MSEWTISNHLRKILPGIILLTAFLGCQDVPPNSAPEVTDVLSYPTQPKAGQIVILTAIASDADGDAIRFRWMANGGSFLDTLGSNPIHWQAPPDTGTISIYLQASDQEATTSHNHQFFLDSGVGSVAGHVRDASSEDLLSGVIVNMNGAEATTGTDGYFYFAEVQSGDNIPISASVSNYVTYAQLVDVEVEENIIDISLTLLTEVGRIAGYVSDAVSGLKLEGVLVQTGGIQATSGSDGYYELYNVPISVNVPVRATHTAYLINSSLLNVVAGYNSHNISLEPNIATVSGRVRAESNGAYLAGAIVSVNELSDTTDAAGFYSFSNVPVSSNVSISAGLAGYYTTYVIMDIMGGNNNVDLQLGQSSGSLTGWVRSSLDGSVIANASIQIGGSMLNSQSDGHYLADELGIGTMLVTCVAANHFTYTTLVDIFAGSNSLDINLAPSTGSLSGYLLDSLTGEPLASQSISLGSLSTLSATDGHYEFEDVAVGQHLLSVSRTGYQNYSKIVTIVAGSSLQNIVMSPSVAMVVGIVRDAHSNSVLAGAVVAIGAVRDTSDASGYYMLSGIERGSRLINASAAYHYTYGEVITVGLGENIHNLALDPSVGSVTGQVHDQDTGLALAGIQVSVADSSYTSDASGQFTVLNFPLGQVEVRVQESGYQSYSTYHDIVVGNNIISIELNPAVGQLMGFVTDSLTSEPLDSVQVILGSDSTLSNVNGYYQFVDIPVAEDMAFQAQTMGYVTHVQWVTVAGGSNVLDVSLTATE